MLHFPFCHLKETLAMAEKKAMEKALEAAEGNKLEAAKLLGVSKTNFYEKCRAYSI